MAKPAAVFSQSAATTVVTTNDMPDKCTKLPPAVTVAADLQAKRGCNRCKDCPGYMAHDWRNTCTRCKCTRSTHMLVGSNCCAVDRIGFEPLISIGGGSNSVSPGCRAKALAEAEGYTWIPMVGRVVVGVLYIVILTRLFSGDPIGTH